MITFTRDDMRDVITDEIGDCFAAELTSGEGADAIIRKCGLWELYEIADTLARSGFGIPAPYRTELQWALAKVRGEALTDCPGHVASDLNPKVCRYCATHVDGERDEQVTA
jgi:hypothetical protein